jgi:hypothetical protein
MARVRVELLAPAYDVSSEIVVGKVQEARGIPGN